MIVLVGCEESQQVCKAFRAVGHIAYSCDLQDCSGGHPEWHLKMDVFEAVKVLKEKYGRIDIGIFFPPCPYLTKASAAHWKKPERKILQRQAAEFVIQIANLKITRIAIENPIGILSTIWRKPDQIIKPFLFGHPYTKDTCLWLKNLPLLKNTKLVIPKANWVRPGNIRQRQFNRVKEGAGGNKKLRSTTFQGIAVAMANQWG